MTPIDNARLTFELHAALLQRALGRGGAPVDLSRAQAELEQTQAALRALAAVLADTRK